MRFQSMPLSSWFVIISRSYCSSKKIYSKRVTLYLEQTRCVSGTVSLDSRLVWWLGVPGIGSSFPSADDENLETSSFGRFVVSVIDLRTAKPKDWLPRRWPHYSIWVTSIFTLQPVFFNAAVYSLYVCVCVCFCVGSCTCGCGEAQGEVSVQAERGPC